MKKYTKEELYKMDAIDVYKMVLRGEITTGGATIDIIKKVKK